MDESLDISVTEPLSFRQAVDALGLGMAFRIHASADGRSRRFVELGESCRAMTGVDPAAALRDATLLYDQILPEHRAEMEAAERAALAVKRRFEAEVRMRGPAGDVRWRRITSAPTQLPDGSTIWDGVLIDITEAKRVQAELVEQRRRLEAAVEATGIGLWEWDVRGGHITWSDRNRELFGVGKDEILSIAKYLELVHPEDRDAVQQTYVEASRKPAGGDFVVEHRTTYAPEGRPRWIQARGRVVKDEHGVKLVVGAALDVSDRREADDRRTLLMRELAHRAKNGIQVMIGIVAQTARSAASVEEFEAVLLARLRAMAASQDLVTASGGAPVRLADVVATTLTPFDVGRFEVDEALRELTVAGDVAVALALLLHELSTNAVKYGALSARDGKVTIARAPCADGRATVTWRERGGPVVRGSRRRGFGSRLIDVVLRPQGGKVDARFEPQGFSASIEFPAARPGPETAH